MKERRKKKDNIYNAIWMDEKTKYIKTSLPYFTLLYTCWEDQHRRGPHKSAGGLSYGQKADEAQGGDKR